ncbi:CHAT domain-containing protein [Planktothrix sp. FACHB-1365]|uniref:CHAT domain-containing protein n=1 Tax=Planktothrix sp. FACHB-1365 TaxID=2692855 RepID=UPI0016855C69|nr:CHAT domain-containing protein [Planktothrix sp. FACHB-1365]MBD2483414.1 CHAT domain-containing protein [Planktothrix sp. FACHB-1365]
MQPGRFLKLVLISLPLTGLWTVGMNGVWEIFRGNQKVIFSLNKVLAQSIIPEANSTNTLTNSVGNRVDITGGQASGDGGNLFHSFTQFNVPQGQTVNFVSNPSIQNILSRVVGGQPSLIDGLIQVTGGNSNLFILNPAGIIFGSGARLDVPAAFTATTATGIGFNSGFFNAVDSNNYNALSGEPNTFLFSTSNPGNIINAGELTVSSGQTLTLVGGNVINTGTLNAPGGQITIAAIEGNNLVRISQDGYLLNLEIATVTPTSETEQSVINPLSLPELLTGTGENNQASIVNILPDGTVELTASSANLPPQGGVALISGFLNTRNTNLDSSSSTLPQVNIIGNDIQLSNAEIDASAANGGGTIRIGSDYQGNGFFPTASRTFINDQSTIIADALTNGNGGRVSIGSHDLTRFFGNISTQGSSNSQTSEGLGGSATIFSQNNLNIAGNINLKGSDGKPGNLVINAAEINIGNQDQSNANITLSDQTLEDFATTANVIIEAKNNITIADLADNELRFPATTGTLTFTADADQSGSGGFTMNSGDTLRTSGAAIAITGVNLVTGDIITQGGNLDLTATNNGGIRTENLSTSNSGNGGDLTIKSDRDIVTDKISTFSNRNGSGGTVNLSTLNRIQTNNINTSGQVQAGDITLSSLQGDIILEGDSYSIDATSGQGSGGNVLVNTPRTLTTNLIDTRGQETGGNIILNAELATEIRGLRTGTFNSLENATGNIEITSDEINFTGGQNSIQGKGQILLQPATLAQDIEIAGQNNNAELTLNLSSSDLNSLENGFTEIIIGGSHSNGTIFIAGNVSFQDPVVIQSPQGGIASGTPLREQFYTLTGLDDASLKLFASENITLGTLVTNGQNILITSELGTVSTQNLSTGNSASATIQLTGTEINFLGGLNSIQGLGTLLLQPSRNTQAITLAGSEQSSSFDISNQDLETFADGFSSIKIGRTDSISTLTLAGNSTISDPLNLQAQSILGTGRLTGIDNASLTLSAGSDILIGDMSTEGGTIQLSSSQGNIRTGALQLVSGNPGIGDINLSAAGNIETGEIRVNSQETITGNSNFSLNGQDINLMSRNGTIRVNGEINNSSLEGDTVAIELFAPGAITTGNMTAYRGINLTSSQGQIITGNLQTLQGIEKSQGINLTGYIGIKTDNINTTTPSGISSNITLNSATGSVQSGDLNTVGITRGGTITVVAGDRINTGTIDASSPEGSSGNIGLNASQDIDVISIRGEGKTQGGDIGIATHGLFRVTGTFNSRNQMNASISSVGGEEGGSIVIQQGGDYCSTSECSNIPFTVGNATLNGTTGAITDGNLVTILPPTNTNPNSTVTTGSTQAVVNQINSELQVNNQDNQTPPVTPQTDGSTTPVLTNSTSDSSLNSTSEPSSQPEEISENPIIPLNTPTIPTDQISSGSVISSLAQIDTFRGIEFSNYLGSNLKNPPVTDQSIRKTLNEIYKLTNSKSAIVYVSAQSNQLELRLILPEGQPIFKSIPVSRETVLKTARTFSNQIRSPENLEDTRYKENGKQLHDWLIKPLESQLEAEGINTLVFSMDTGLRTLPLAALYNGKQFLVERYSLGLIPSLSLTDTRYVNIKNSKVLAMGASIFPNSDQQPLPAVPLELNLIINQNIWQGLSFLNDKFTIDNLTSQRNQHQFSIVHLATHGEFQTGGSDQSYIQFWDQKLRLTELRKLKLHQPPVELLVLSACTTAVGDEKAELGFAGLAVQAGVKSALASLWYVSDAGTLGLMNTFYEALSTSPIKAEALRQAQLAMLQGKVRLQQGYLIDETATETAKIPLPPEIASRGNVNLSHPFYWAGFTLIGSPW